MPARDLLIEHLHRLQDEDGGLFPGRLARLADEFGLAISEVVETASFYAHFRLLGDQDAAPARPVRVCGGPICAMGGADALRRDLGQAVDVEDAPCMGLCDHAPAALARTVPVRSATGPAVSDALANGRPTAVASSAVAGGWRGGDRARILDEIDMAGLRGMGGAGFPTVRKWRTVAAQPGPRLVVVNADEGEPGTFKDRHFLETATDRVLDGAMIAAWVVGADAVYVYLRDEYTDLRPGIEDRIRALPAGSPPVFVRRGAGAYVCGEESALIESLEGKRGLPRQRPPLVAEVGLFGRPTLVNNVETLYWVSRIVEEGSGLFTGRGRNGQSGLRTYSVSGRVRTPGVKIADNGLTIGELIEEQCGGMEAGHQLSFYLPGGASGGFLPARLQPPLAFGTIEEHGGFIGSAAVMVFSQADDIKAVALNLARFFAHESCGQCTPCRLGTERAAGLIAQGRWDREMLDDLAHVMRQASICGLGQAAPNVWQSLFRHFPEVL